VNSRVYFDANIILDIIDVDRTKHLSAKELWKNLLINNQTIVTSEDILTNVFYISKNKKDVLLFFKYIQDKWIISSFGKDIIKKAIDIALEKSLDLEDVLQCLCAKENACKTLITHDKKFFDCGLKIQTISEFTEI